ncbi:hypothetical protein D9M71_215630 [compost metagenome]
MRVHHLAGTAGGNTGGGEQRHVFIGFDHRHVRGFAGGDHAVGEIIMAYAVEHDHVQPADALDVFGAGFVGMRVETGRNQRHHFGLVADDVRHVAVIRVQGDADAQALGCLGTGEGWQQAGQQADQ